MLAFVPFAHRPLANSLNLEFFCKDLEKVCKGFLSIAKYNGVNFNPAFVSNL